MDDYDSDGFYFDGNDNFPTEIDTDCFNDGMGVQNIPYEMFNVEKLLDLMNSMIDDVEQIVQFSRTYLRLLLAKYKWDKDRLIENYFDYGEEKFLLDAGFILPSQSKVDELKTDRKTPEDQQTCQPNSQLPIAKATRSKSNLQKQQNNYKANKYPALISNEKVCEICFNSADAANMAGTGCGHEFCLDCWRYYLNQRIIVEYQADRIYCPGHNCYVIVDDFFIYKLMDSNVCHKFKIKTARSFVRCNPYLTWCPGNDCNLVAFVQRNEPIRIDCKNCSTVFCFKCGEDWHEPVKCGLLMKWLKKMRDDSETSNWIVANTKECPKCRATIEKNGGCNHMICKNASCQYQFCWVCLDQWEPHGSAWYNCSRYNETDAQKARDSQESCRAALQRYLFYFNRYTNHLQSLKFESKLYTEVQSKMEEMQLHNMSWIEVQFLKKAVDVLCDCRRTLNYTYVFAYYLKRNNHSELFETNQSDLSKATEQLSEYLERDITTDCLLDIKQRVQDKYRYCNQRRKALLKMVQEGYEKDWWDHMEL